MSLPRTVFFVCGNLAGFTAVCAFMYYLTAGRWLDFSLAGYRRSLIVPLNEMMIRPLSIFSHPWMIVIAGLVIATVAFVPVMVALLYRLRVAALFVLAVAALAHAPLLAFALAVGCMLAGKTRMRSDLPFLGMLLGLSPVVVYLAFFSFGSDVVLTPLQQAAMLAPYGLALVAALLACGVVLVLAKATRFRPGVIWPVLLVLLGTPIWLFYQKVGPAELEYALIVERVGAGHPLLSPRGGSDRRYAASVSATRPATKRVEPGEFPSPAELLQLCRGFLDRCPGHTRGAEVMWIRAAALEAQIKALAASAPSTGAGGAELHTLMVHAWTDLAREHSSSPQAMVAHQRLGIEALREGRFHEAYEHLRDAQSMLVAYLEAEDSAPPSLWRRVFIPVKSLPGRPHYVAVLSDTDRIIWLMEANGIQEGSSQDRDAFREYMRAWPFADVSRDYLLEMAAGFEGTKLADNFRLRAALAEQDEQDRAWRLRQIIEDRNDAAVVANYELGVLGLTLADTDVWKAMDLSPPEKYLRVVVSWLENPYREPAERHLAWLEHTKPAGP